MVTGCLQQCRPRRAEQIYPTHTKHTHTHSQTYRHTLVQGSARHQSSGQGQCTAAAMRCERRPHPLPSQKADKVRQCCICVCFPLCRGSLTAGKMSSVFEHVHVCLIKAPMSPRFSESEAQPDPPPAGTVMPPPKPLPTLHLVPHQEEEEKKFYIINMCVCA